MTVYEVLVGVSYIDYFVLPSDAGATRCKNYGDWDTSVIPSTAQSCTQYDVFSHFNQPFPNLQG